MPSWSTVVGTAFDSNLRAPRLDPHGGNMKFNPPTRTFADPDAKDPDHEQHRYFFVSLEN